jgi:CRISPR/Cas system-associated exonuclease Cas4 (RecB family)
MENPNLKNFKDTYKRREILLPQIERHVLKKAQEPSDRRSDILHPSEMAKVSWCPRHDFYRLTEVPANYKKRAPSFKLENVFDYGHSVHAKYQRWLQEMGILFGKWRCKECLNQWEGYAPEHCPSCLSRKVVYKEVSLVDEDLMIAGHSDGIVKMGDDNYMIEIKTIGYGSLRFEAQTLFEKSQQENWTIEELWFQIQRPFSSHIRQGQIYLHLAKKAYPDLNVDKIIYIYEWKPTQEVKEFVISYNPEFVQDRLDLAAEIANHVTNGTEMERPSWADPEKKTCSSCEYRKTCWGEANGSSKDIETKSIIRIKKADAAKRRRVVRP